MCTTLVRNGCYAIETLVRMETYARGISNFRLLKHGQGYCEENFSNSMLSNCPSNNAITTLFVTVFLENEGHYLREIERVTVGQTISFDHTFKVASNIGYCRCDNVWVPLYDSLFIQTIIGGGYITTFGPD